MSVAGIANEGFAPLHTAAEPAGPCVAVVGSRDFADLDRVRRFVATLPSGVVLLSGGARGVDRCAVEAARARGLRFLEYLADWDRDGRYLAGRIRNQRVAERCDRMVAFWDGRSTGTHDAWQRALQLHRRLVLYRLRSVALVGTLGSAAAVAAPDGTAGAELTLVAVSPGSDGRPLTKSYRIAASGDLAAVVAALPIGKRLRVRAACRQVFLTDAAGVLRPHRPATYEAHSIKRLPGKRRAA
jgi:hypothetical protein